MTTKLLLFLAAGAATVAGAAFAPATNALGSTVSKAPQKLAVLTKSHKVASTPGGRRSTKISAVAATRPITGGGTILPIVGHATKKRVEWLRVMLPGRPNGTRGWITERGTAAAITDWRLVVKTSTRQVRAYHRGRLARSFSAVVGTPSTPTPSGKYFVEESIRMASTAVGAPFALALSARSNVFQEFEGGPGQIGIHGVANLGGTMGTASSHGCVRLENRNIRWLAARIGAGVPVTITR